MAETDADLIQEAKEQFKDCEDAWSENRERGEEAIRFGRMGEQWSEADKLARKDRPCLVVNKMPTQIRQVVNDARQNKPGIKVHPVDGEGDPEVAEVFNGLIRQIEVASDAEVAYDTAIDQAASGGIGFLRIDLAHPFEDSFDLDIRINRVMDPWSVYGDPKSKAADSSDWDLAFVVSSLKEDEFKRKYPKAKETVSWQGGESADEGWRSDDEIRIAEYWKRTEEERDIVLLSNGMVLPAESLTEEVEIENGETILGKDIIALRGLKVIRERTATFRKVTQRLVTGAEVLKTVEWMGQYIPIIPVYGEEVVIGGKRHWYSLIHWGMDPQRIYNYGRSASIETVALQPKAPYVGWVGQFNTDSTRWASANTENYAYLQADPPPDGAPPTLPQRQGPPQPSAGWLQETQIAADDIKAAIGMFNASTGERSNEVSGKAINARKLEGDVSTFHFIDNLSRAIRHAGRIIVDLIPKVYDRPRMIRVLGEDRRESKMIKIGPQQPAQPPQQALPAPGGMPMQPGMQQPQQDPRAEAMDKIFDLTVGKYDVTVTAGPSFTTRRIEAAEQLIELAQAFPQLVQVAGDIIIKGLDMPGGDELVERVQMAQKMAMGAKGKSEKPEADPAQKAMIDAQAKVKATEITTAGRIQETQIRTAAQRQTDQERIVAEQQTAAQQQAVSAMAGQRPPSMSPGGDIAR